MTARVPSESVPALRRNAHAAIGFVVLLGLLLPKLAIPGGNDPPVIEGSVAKFNFVRLYRGTPLAPTLDTMSKSA